MKPTKPKMFLNLTTKLTIIEWIKANKEEVENNYPDKIAELIKADKGIECNENNIITICKAINHNYKTKHTKRHTNPTYNLKLGTDKTIILAKSIRHIAKELGIELKYAKQINEIIGRDPITPGEEPSNTEN